MLKPEDNILKVLEEAGKPLSVGEIFELNKDFETKIDLTQQLLEMIADQTIEAAEVVGVRKYALNGVLGLEPSTLAALAEPAAPTEPQVGCAVRTHEEEAPAHNNSKIYNMLKLLEERGDWVSNKELKLNFGITCAVDYLKTHIKDGYVLTQNLGHGKKMLKLADNVSALDCVLAASKRQAEGSKKRNQKKHTKPAKALDVPVFLAQKLAQPTPAQVGCAVRTQTEEVRTAHPTVLPDKELRQLLSWANDSETHITEAPKPHVKPFRIAFTSDACLILQNANMGNYQADIELDAAQTRALVEFIQTADIEALI